MELTREQSEIIMTALQDYRSNLYLDGNHGAAVEKVSELILNIENNQESKDISQKRIPIETGSETGIELEDSYNMKPGGCVNCDE
tara:strand:+ start:364 stop:618 length:255 start_codon:yes stop_codon:yes gene_type:complete